MSKSVVIIGPAHPLRGGIAVFNERLCREFLKHNITCTIHSFSLQYPSILFPGTSQYSSEPAPTDITIRPRINSINPFNWLKVGRELRRLAPDIILVRFWLPFMAAALGTILRRIRKNKHTVIIALTDNVKPHEKRPGDVWLTRYFLSSCDGFITMSDQVMQDLRQFEKHRPAYLVAHPVYDIFGEKVSRGEARQKLGLPMNGNMLLFFGFIRRYKGLDLLLEAMSIFRERYASKHTSSTRLVVAGEFYDKPEDYLKQIDLLGISDMIILKTSFIPDSDVKYYMSATNVVVQPYRHATQSGVTPLAYHFEKPMIVTNVGGLPALVPPGAGIVCEPTAASLAQAIDEFFHLGEDYFIPHLRNEKKKYSWNSLVEAIIKLADELKK